MGWLVCLAELEEGNSNWVTFFRTTLYLPQAHHQVHPGGPAQELRHAHRHREPQVLRLLQVQDEHAGSDQGKVFTVTPLGEGENFYCNYTERD